MIGSIATYYSPAIFCAVLSHDDSSKNDFMSCKYDTVNQDGKGTMKRKRLEKEESLASEGIWWRGLTCEWQQSQTAFTILQLWLNFVAGRANMLYFILESIMIVRLFEARWAPRDPGRARKLKRAWAWHPSGVKSGTRKGLNDFLLIQILVPMRTKVLTSSSSDNRMGHELLRAD